MKLSQLATSASLTYQGLNPEVTHISCHSGKIQSGGLFFAIQGTQTDGVDFIPQAVQNGAVAVVAEREVSSDVPVLVVSDIRRVMAQMADALWPSKQLKKVAVTGTNGKTSTVYYVSQILNSLGRICASMGTIGINSPLFKTDGSMTTPDTVLLHQSLNKLEQVGVQAVAMEASSHGLDQDRLFGVQLEAGAFTNLTQDHLDYHKTMDSYLQAKMRLFDRIKPNGFVVLNADIPEFDVLKNEAEKKSLQVISYGLNGEQLRLLSYKPLATGQRMEVNAFGKNYDIELNVVGDFQLMNILCAIGLCIGLGIDSEDIMSVIHLLQAPAGRLERVAVLKNGATVYVDYAHTPDALERVLKTMRPHTTGQLVCLFGCGGNRDTGKRSLMGKIAQDLADKVYITDDNPRFEQPADIRSQIAQACPKGIEIGDRHIAILTAVSQLQSGDVLVLAGKGHETGQVIQGISYVFNDKTEALLAAQQCEQQPLWQADELRACLSADVPVGLNAYGVSIDTRTLSLGDIYIALRGENTDGHRFIKDAVQKGAAVCLVEQLSEDVPVSKQIVVSDTMQALNRLAVFARNRSSAHFIAVTGSSGKTTTKEMLRVVLSAQGITHATSGNYNNHIGVPLTLSQMPLGTQYAIIETGMNHVGELTELSALVRPHVAIITMIGAAHLAHFTDEKQIAMAKAEIFSGMENGATVVLNADDKFYGLLREQSYQNGVRHIVSFGREIEADFVLKDCQAVGDRTKIYADWHGTPMHYDIGFLGDHFAMNSLAVLGAVDAVEASVEQALKSLSETSAGAGRGATETIRMQNGKTCVLIDDSYNANPASMAASIRSLGLRSGNTKVAVLGDMLELGETQIDLHIGLKDALIAAGIDCVFAVGAISRHLFEALPTDKQGLWCETAEQMAEKLPDLLPDGAVVLVKASNGTGLKKVVLALKGC